MHRRKPASSKQKKADLKVKRAVKRGDIPPPETKPGPSRSNRTRRGPTGRPLNNPEHGGNHATSPPTGVQSRQLQSSFVKLSSEFLEETRHLASTLPLPRPIPSEIAVYPEALAKADFEGAGDLSCPKRPKWRFDMGKKEVERNEEGMFRRWIDETDAVVEKWRGSGQNQLDPGDDTPAQEDQHVMPRSPTYFERNIEVWRQLWRVTEISQIILVLLDSRCPPIHYPPSLHTYLSTLRPARKIILVLTKVDISGPERADAWTAYLLRHYPGIRVVQVEAYAEKDPMKDSVGQGKRRTFMPYLPGVFRERLIRTLEDVHTEMLEPPEKLRGQEEKLKNWRPSVKANVNWERVLKASGGNVGSAVGGPTMPHTKEGEGRDGDEFLTIGLIGQPNVGKSSLLNAIFGTHKVKASRTPGKTKHFQTLFWTSEVRLVDCPGLVMPNFIPMEFQVLCGILPISQIPSTPSCVHLASCHLPLEHVFYLMHPSHNSLRPEDKRTWRDRSKPNPSAKERAMFWTAMDVMTAFAEKKGWVTAKAGRPDVHRAGNAILRSLAESKVRWAFWPPAVSLSPGLLGLQGEPGCGIWLPHNTSEEEEDDGTSDPRSEGDSHDDSNVVQLDNSDEEEEGTSEDEIESDGGGSRAKSGKFDVLVIDATGDNDDEDEDSNSVSSLSDMHPKHW